MSVSNTASKAGPYTANGSQTAFVFNFKVFSKNDLRVVKTVSGVESDLVVDTDFTVAFNPDQSVSPGGTITTTTTFAAGILVTIVPNLAATQQASLTNYRPNVIEDALDRLTILIQQLAEKVSRSVQTNVSSSILPSDLMSSLNASIASAQTYASDAATSATAASTSAANAAATSAAFLSGISLPTGASLIGVEQPFIGAVARTVQLKQTESVSVKDFGAVGDGVVDDTVAIQKARDYLASQAVAPALIFPAGTYKYSASPNWAFQGCNVYANGTVYLKYTGTENAVDLTSNTKVSNVCFGRYGEFIIQAPASAKNGLLAKNIVRGHIKARCYGAGATYAAFRYEGCVLLSSELTISNDEGGWYLSAKPKYGIYLTNTGAANTQTSYCTFLNWSVQSCDIGVFLDATLGNIFVGGDSEYNTQYGVQLTLNALNNRFIGSDFEVNTSDVLCNGKYNEFISCDTNTNITLQSDSISNVLMGGTHDSIIFNAGSQGNMCEGIKYNRSLGSSVITDNGVRNRFRNTLNMLGNIWRDVPSSNGIITVTASPFIYTNATGNPIKLFISNGTVTSINYYDGGTNLGNLPAQSEIEVLPGDALAIVYSVAPTIRYRTI